MGLYRPPAYVIVYCEINNLHARLRMGVQSLHRALLCLEAYPGESGPIGYRETHISRLYFTAQCVYKVKKPVDLGFLNFNSLDRRRFYCLEEVRLNNRFFPDT